MKLKSMSLFGVICFAASAFCAEKAAISVVMSGSFPPWNSEVSKGKYEGFEPDMMQEVCLRMNRKCKFSVISNEKLFPAVRFDKYDIGISGVGVNKNMEKVVLTSDSYGKKGYVLVTKKHSFLASDFCEGSLKSICGEKFDVSDVKNDNPTKLRDIASQLKGYMVGVQVGTCEEWLSKMLNGVNTQKAYSQDELLQMMKNREVNTVILNNEYWHHLSKLPEYQVYGTVGPIFYGGHLDSKVAAIAKKGDTELMAEINQILGDMRIDGTLEKLSTKWFGEDITN